MSRDNARERLARALVETMLRVSKRYPEMPLTDVCAAVGIAVGTVVGSGVPAGQPETDIVLGNVIGYAYGEGVRAIRQQRAS